MLCLITVNYTNTFMHHIWSGMHMYSCTVINCIVLVIHVVPFFVLIPRHPNFISNQRPTRHKLTGLFTISYKLDKAALYLAQDKMLNLLG